jgi:CDP-6-deoxy-D-xylo-4-hexulose-3-dehydrase
MAGYKIKFCDINLQDFCFDYEKLEEILDKNKDKNLILWPTALIGFCPNFCKLQALAKKYNAELWGDFCENQFSTYDKKSIFSQVDVSSLSCYFSHMITSIEMGFVFIKDNYDYECAKMLRNHGLTRSLEENSRLKRKIEEKYDNIDKQFLFAVLGTNWRTTDMHAIWGILDMKRAEKYKLHRKQIYQYFINGLNLDKYLFPDYHRAGSEKREDVAFCLPILRIDDKITDVKNELNREGISTRPIIGGCLTLQPPFKKYHDKKAFPNGLWISNHGAYVGLLNNLKIKYIDNLTNILNRV